MPLLLLDCLPGHERWRRGLAVERRLMTGTRSPARSPVRSIISQRLRPHSTGSKGSSDDLGCRSSSICRRKLGRLRTVLKGHASSPSLHQVRRDDDEADYLAAGPMSSGPSQCVVTGCLDPSEGVRLHLHRHYIDPDSLYAARDEVVERFRRSISPECVDPRLDYWFCPVCVERLKEVGMHRIHTRIIERCCSSVG